MLQVFETERLLLKPRSMDDLPNCVEMDIDPEVTRYIPGVWDGKQKHITFLEERIIKNHPPGLGYWSIFFKEQPDEFLGWVHLLAADDKESVTEIGWRLKRRAWGKGYATEAAKTILSYAFNVIGSERVVAHTHADNIRSQKVMDRLGLKYTGDFLYNKSIPCVSYEISRESYH